MISIDCYNSKNLQREFMKKFNILIATSAIVLFATGCVKPVQDTQTVYNDTTQAVVYQEEGQPIVYEPSAGTVYEEVQQDATVITTTTAIGQQVGEMTTYPDPYANANAGTGTVYNDPYASQPVITDYPASSSTSVAQGGGIHLQIAALKEYFTAEDYKNRLSLAPGLSAYVQRGAMNKVIITGIPSIAEANRLKESRFPGAFIVQGTSSVGYTPTVQPSYDTTGTGAYNINNPYGTSSSSNISGNSGIGVQVGAFGSQGKAQSVANSQSGQYPATVKKIGQYYKVILTGFASRSAAKAYASRVGGFIVDVY
jgi:hypothetical protein